MDALWVVEGTSSYGAILTGTLISQCFRVAEAPFIALSHHGGKGKDDEVDSGRIARSVLALDESELRVPRTGDGIRACLQILVTAREELTPRPRAHKPAQRAPVGPRRGNTPGLVAGGVATPT